MHLPDWGSLYRDHSAGLSLLSLLSSRGKANIRPLLGASVLSCHPGLTWSTQSPDRRGGAALGLVLHQDSACEVPLGLFHQPGSIISAPHLQSEGHSSLHFPCTAGRYTPLLGKCLPNYNHLENEAGAFHLLLDSANEEIQIWRS